MKFKSSYKDIGELLNDFFKARSTLAKDRLVIIEKPKSEADEDELTKNILRLIVESLSMLIGFTNAGFQGDLEKTDKSVREFLDFHVSRILRDYDDIEKKGDDNGAYN